MSYSMNHKRKQNFKCFVGSFELWNCVGVTDPKRINNYEQKSLFQMAAAMCQALPGFYSDDCEKPLFFSVFSDFYEK